MHAVHEKYACVLIGETTLLIQCAEILRARDFRIAGIVSPDTKVTDWAQSLAVPVLATYTGLNGYLASLDFDYLLSIVNSAILPDQVLAMPRVAAINYHDAPLPRYAGVHATTWAILNGETEHAISWHLMTQQADEGDILVQNPVPVLPRDTVQILNARCYEEAIRSFALLCDQMASGRVSGTPQDLSQRTYYGLYQRPDHAGFLQFERTTSELLNVCRAMSYPPSYKNPFTTAKLLLGEEKACIVGSVEAGPLLPGRRSGEIVAADADGLTIATSDGSLRISSLSSLDGQLLSIPALREQGIITVSQRLTSPDPATLAPLHAQLSALVRHDNFWEAQLTALLAAAPAPLLRQDADERPVVHHLHFPPSLARRLQDEPIEHLAAACALFLTALHPEPPRIGLAHAGTGWPPSESLNLAAPVVPLTLPFVRGLTPAGLKTLAGQVQNLMKKKSYLRDLLYRSPHLPRDGALLYDYVMALGEEQEETLRPPADQRRLLAISPHGLGWYSDARDEMDGETLLARCRHFLEQLYTTEWQTLAGVSLLWPDEAAPWAVTTGVSDDHQWPVHLLFSRQAARASELPAVIHETTIWSYGDLERRSDQVARHLLARPAAERRIVAICLERTPELIAVLLGVLKAGAAWLPLVTNLPAGRLGTIVADAGARLAITSRQLAPTLAGTAARPLLLEELFAGPAPAAELPPEEMEAPAYVIYTSGSTGKPKGVVIGHRSLAGFVQDGIRRYGLRPGDRVLQFASIAFDAAVEEIFPALCSGAALVLRSEEMLSSIPALIRGCQRHGITHLDLPTAYWSLLVSESQSAGLRLPESIRLVITGGEALTEAMFTAWKQQYRDYPRLVNTYGPTEATVVATVFAYDGAWPHPFMPIGRPIDHVQARVLNEFEQELPAGCTGELVLGGSCLAQGYLNEPELTQKAFVELKLGLHPERYYRTGDLVKRLGDGNLVFAGRKDKQIKIRGFRVELDEIRSALAAMPEVKDCAVTDFGQALDKQLAAYIVFRGQPFGLAEMRQRLATSLPDYMLPAVMIAVEQIPLTANMKVDYRSLPDPALAARPKEEESETGSPLEQTIREIWEEVLQRKFFGLDDDFFASGGNSLAAVRIMTALEKRCGKSLPVSVMFEYGTIRKLAALLESGEQEEKWRPLVPIKKGGGKIPLFIIHGAGLNILLFNTLSHHMHPDQPVYGLQARQLDKDGHEVSDLAEIVKAYADEIMTVQPHGPFALAGFSIGGFIAFELGNYFHALGEEVIFLGIFDTYAGDPEPAPGGLAGKVGRGWLLLKKMVFSLQITLRHPAQSLPLRWRWLKNNLINLLNRRKFEKVDMDIAHLPEDIARRATAIIAAVERHRFQPYSGRLHLFRAQHRLFYVPEKRFMGWKRYVDDIRVFDIPGDHSFIFAPPNDVAFAATLQQALDEEATAWARRSGPKRVDDPGTAAV